MAFDGDAEFLQDVEFRKLLAREPIELPLVLLEIARDSHPQLDPQPTLEWLAERGRELRARVVRLVDERETLEQLVLLLAGEHGLCGDEACYGDPAASHLNRVVETGRGLPILLSLVYVFVADQAGFEVFPVAAPGHFLCGCETAEGTIYIDAFDRGRMLDEDECIRWLKQLTGLDTRAVESSLRPADPRSVVIRTLNNLKAVAMRQEQWDLAYRTQLRLLVLQPGRFEERRDLAFFAARDGRTGEARRRLQACLADCPDDQRAALEDHMALVDRQQAQWN